MAEISDAELARYKRIEAAAKRYTATGNDVYLAPSLKPAYDPLVSDAESFAATDVHCSQWHRQKLGALYLRKAADRVVVETRLGWPEDMKVSDMLRIWADAEEKL